MTRWSQVVVTGIASGCAGFPDVTTVEALDQSGVVATLAPTDEAAFTDDLPTHVSFALVFDETMALPSARDHVHIEDEDGAEVDITLDARLERIEVSPTERLAAGLNHTLVIDAAVEDNSGNEMLSGYRIAFYTEEEGDATRR